MVSKFFDKKSASELSEQKVGDFHRSPPISVDESETLSRLYKINLPTPLGRNKEEASETSRANGKAKVSESEENE